MGHAKRQMEQEQEQGWSFTDGWVCSGCVEDVALKAIVLAREVAGKRCDFCDASQSADFDALPEAFVGGLRNEYEDALQGVGWDGRSGGLLWDPKWDTGDLIGEFEHTLIGDGLVDAVREAMHDVVWVERDFASRRRDEELLETWDLFSDAVKHKTRYVLWLSPDEDRHLGAGEISPARILNHIGDLLDQLGLVQELPAGYRLWRAQPHSQEPIEGTASRLGTAPREFSKHANRMSPAGIPMFYAADAAQTAIREVAIGSEEATVTYGQFELSKSIAVVDFTRLPPEPSMFDPELGPLRRQVVFLHAFVQQLSDRVRPEFEQIDYVPTQIITEYLLHIHGNGDPIDGLVDPSSIDGERCVVIDVPNESCVDLASGPDPELVLDSLTVSSSPIDGTWR